MAMWARRLGSGSPRSRNDSCLACALWVSFDCMIWVQLWRSSRWCASLLTEKLNEDMTDRFESEHRRNSNPSLPWPWSSTFSLTLGEGGDQHPAGQWNVRNATTTFRSHGHASAKRMSRSMEETAVFDRLIPPNSRVEKYGNRVFGPQMHDRTPEMGGRTCAVAPSVLAPSIRAISELCNRARCKHSGGQSPAGCFLSELVPAFGRRRPVAGRLGAVG
jgi:hypothetical protein